MSRVFSKTFLSFVFCLVMGGFIWTLSPPEGVAKEAIQVLAIFVFTVLGIILRPIPIGMVAFLGLVLITVTKTLSFEQAFSGFGNPIVWLIVIAFFVSKGFIKTGLGERIAYVIIKYLGKSTIGMAYGMVLTDLVLAPAIPSVTARIGGIIYPIVNSLVRAFGSDPNRSPRKLGAFLMKATFQGSLITSGMFLTAMAGNPLIADLAQSVGVSITWGTWALAGLVPGLFSIAVVPLFLYKIYPPEIRKTPGAKEFAIKQLEKMGKVRPQEWVMIFAFLLLVTLWIFGPKISLSATVAALIGLAVLLLTSVLSWEDVVREKEAWNILVWFAALIMMATFINRFGLTTWFSTFVSAHVMHFPWFTAFIILSLAYFYSHYFFASIVAHIGCMYSAFLVLMVALGAPPVISALILGFFSNLMGGITHYGSGPAPIYFASGYVKITDWWKLGFYVSLVNILIYLTIGTAWWKFLGHI